MYSADFKSGWGFRMMVIDSTLTMTMDRLTNPAWKIGYNLAENARMTLKIGQSPISSMRELVEKRLGIPCHPGAAS